MKASSSSGSKVQMRFVTIFFAVIIVVMSLLECESKIDLQRKTSIDFVFTAIFTAPDEKLLQLVPSMQIDGANSIKSQNSATKIARYHEKLGSIYGDYFTKEGFANFTLSLLPFQYHERCYNTGYTMSVKDIVSTKDEGDTTTETVTMTVVCVAKTLSELTVSARVQCDDKGKIGWLKLDTDSIKALDEVFFIDAYYDLYGQFRL